MAAANRPVKKLRDQGIGMTSMRHRQGLVDRLREKGIRNEAVLQAILETPRHRFLSDAVARHAYRDDALPIGYDQTISQPYVVALMTQALLEPLAPKTVLEIGTGSGYQSAILAKLVRRVYTVERIPQLHEQATELLRGLKHRNVMTRLGDGSRGWPERAPYEAIMVTAATPSLPEALQEQLAEGGRLVMPEGAPHGVQRLVRCTRTAEGMEREPMVEVMFVPLVRGVG